MDKLIDIKVNKKFPFIHIGLKDLYVLLMEFMVIGILGFLMETLLEYFFWTGFTDRGFLCGPFIPIYGFGLLLILFFVKIPKRNFKTFFIYAFLIGVIASLLEFLVGNICEAMTGTVLWTYDESVPLSYKYVSLPIGVAWGLVGTLYLMYVVPFVKKVFLKLNNAERITISSIFLGSLISDFILTLVLINRNGGYKELYQAEPSIELTLFIFGIIAYFIAMITFGVLILKVIKKEIYWISPLYIVIYFILMNLPAFSAYDYIYRPENKILLGLSIAGFLTAAFFIYFALAFIIFETLRFVVIKIFKKYDLKTKLNRFILISIEMIVAVYVCFVGVISLKMPVITKIEAGSGNDSLNIVALSDIHYESTGSILKLEDMVEDINGLNPDLVLFIGDIIDNKVERIDKDYFNQEISKIKSTYGIYGVGGNHEYETNTYFDIYNFFKDGPIEMLYDKEIIIDEKIRIAGRIDYIYGGKDSKRTSLSNIVSDSNLPLIVLDHQPYDYMDSYNVGAKLQISGHTHNGQLFPANWIIDFQSILTNKFPVSGLFEKDDFICYTTRGYGSWGFPIRTTGRAEVLQVNFKY